MNTEEQWEKVPYSENLFVKKLTYGIFILDSETKNKVYIPNREWENFISKLKEVKYE